MDAAERVALMIAEYKPPPASWVEVIVMALNPAAASNALYSVLVNVPQAQPTACSAADDRAHEQLEHLIAAGVEAGEWPAGTDPALVARLFTAGLYGLMAQWHLAPGSFSWPAAAAALAGSPASEGVSSSAAGLA